MAGKPQGEAPEVVVPWPRPVGPSAVVPLVEDLRADNQIHLVVAQVYPYVANLPVGGQWVVEQLMATQVVAVV